MNTKHAPSPTGPIIVYSQYGSRQAAAEQCVAVHGLTYLVAGSLRVTEAATSQTFGAGSLLFSRKNYLAKFIKYPTEKAPFQAITVTFDQATLRQFSQRPSLGGEQLSQDRAAVLPLASNPLLHSFYKTLQPYFDEPLPVALATGKQQEALALLLQAHPALDAVLFNFGQPGKIDLEAFMRENFRFNIELKQLAYLTGRSLAAFKRDFDRIFHVAPARWLYQKRLEEAHYLLREEHQRPSEVYHAVGFESLAHFSHAFKQFFGCPPSSVYTAAPAELGPSGCVAATSRT